MIIFVASSLSECTLPYGRAPIEGGWAGSLFLPQRYHRIDTRRPSGRQQDEAAILKTTPAPINTAPLPSTAWRISAGVAPIAVRMPNSTVRCVTD